MTNNNLHSVPGRLRAATSVVAACAALTLSVALPAAPAGATPAPDPHPAPSSRISTRATVDHLRQAYRDAPLGQKLGIHEEIELVLATGQPAL